MNRFKRKEIDSKISKKKFIVTVLLLSGTLAWFFLFQAYFEKIFGAVFSLNKYWLSVNLVVFYGSVAFSAIIGSLISEKVCRRKLLIYWITFSAIVTASLAIIQNAIFAVPLSILLGISFGLGLPSCQALLADATVIDNRARIAGVIILITFVLTFIGAIAIPLMGLGVLLGPIIFLTILRLGGFLALSLDKCERQQGKDISWHSVLTHREFSYYLLPWVMFVIAVGLLDLQDTGAVTAATYSFAFIAIFGLVAGVLADRFGRKPPIIIAVVLFAISFALLSYVLTPETISIYYIIYSIAWGFLFTLFTAIPGDFAIYGSKEKFYAIGTVLPFTIFMGLSAVTGLARLYVPINLLTPLMTVILFISILPLWRSKETLSKEKLYEKEMKRHLEKVEKIIEDSKYS